MFSQGQRKENRRLLGLGDDGIFADAWGKQKITNDYSLFRGLWTFDVSDKIWNEYNNNVEVPKTYATSVNGALKVQSNSNNVRLTSRRHPRYQPNRGLIFSNSLFIDNAAINNGSMYAVIRTYRDGQVIEDRQKINLPDGFDPSKGHIYDIQAQWRGVGNYKFLIDLKDEYHFDYLGNRDELTVNNPALPVTYEVDHFGYARWGMFTTQSGVFYEWVFDVAQDVSVRSGCVDITTEGGKDEIQTFLSIIGNAITVSNDPILAIRLPNTVNGMYNTRDIQLHRIKTPATKKGTVEVWITRDPTALTITTGSWQAINGGNVEKFTPVSASDSSLNESKATLVDIFPVEAGLNNYDDNPSPDLIRFMLAHGDYLILKGTGAGVELHPIVQVGEEI